MNVNRRSALAMGAMALLGISACSTEQADNTAAGGSAETPTIVRTVDDVMVPYNELSDGTYECDGYIYKYRLEITGRTPAAIKDMTYVYLSNIEDISFEKAYMAGGLSSNLDDYFEPEEAVLVDMGVVEED